MLSIVALPAAIAATRWFQGYELLDAAAGIPLALALGLLAIRLARRARTQHQRRLDGLRGARSASIGRALGWVGFLLGVTGAMAIGVFLILSAVD